MAFPTDGLYQLRYFCVPKDDSVTGVVATVLQDLNKPIALASDIYVLFDKQTWEFRRLDADHGKANIIYAPPKGREGSEATGSIGIGTLGFNCTSQEPGTPVELGLLSEFFVQDAGVPDVYFIRPTGDMVGLDYYVGVSDNGTLEVKGYPIGPDATSGPRPAWRFDPILHPK
ncbi:hypothetical protein RSOLAG1IB_09393 [Rhizoctonia solani AG-1 IB]|uniref:Uncharacterized protein n=1 Tax=Thanatephorus cucumeris (strain AG1-IB / isolate 7/3/14) TaxID=1108050 RepID=M5C0K9_THACB|nr:hypothetical protein BN14_07063 [Rhizoctonia solani AG-1 IB]CEL60144.1 hypothetical protein RSOLAG1IB_09393 [Rhizoctonia solani AG-1 IB]